jgi:hypothetical protein
MNYYAAVHYPAVWLFHTYYHVGILFKPRTNTTEWSSFALSL